MQKSYPGEQPIRLRNYADVYYNDEIDTDVELINASASNEQIAKFTLQQGDMIITKFLSKEKFSITDDFYNP